MRAELLHDRGDRCVVVRVTGEVDIATVGALDDVLARAATAGAWAVICDLSGVTFFAVAGLHSLQRAGAALRAAGVAPHLVVDGAAAVMPVLALMIPICGWPSYESIEEATTVALTNG